jgi:hypothetical protein
VQDSDPRLEQAFAEVPREDFLGPGAWADGLRGYLLTPNADPAYLYIDNVVRIIADKRLNNGQPSGHAKPIKVVYRRGGMTLRGNVVVGASLIRRGRRSAWTGAAGFLSETHGRPMLTMFGGLADYADTAVMRSWAAGMQGATRIPAAWGST